MTNTIFQTALLIWSGLFIITGALLMVASQLGHLAEAVAAARRGADAGDSSRATGRALGDRPASGVSRRGGADDTVLFLPTRRRASMQG